MEPNRLKPWTITQATDVIVGDLELKKLPTKGAIPRYKATLHCSINPIPIQRGLVVKSECYVAIKGARFGIGCVGAALEGGTESVNLTATYASSRRGSKNLSITPKIKAKSADRGSIEAELAALSFARGAEASVTFGGEEAILLKTTEPPRIVRWSLSLPRGEKAIRDFLEGPIQLTVNVKPDQVGGNGEVVAAAHPTSRAFFNSDRRELGGLGGWALAVKLWTQGISLPSVDWRVVRRDLSSEE
jgi:hypothetical protein